MHKNWTNKSLNLPPQNEIYSTSPKTNGWIPKMMVWKIKSLRQSVQGRATMAKTIQCADGLEKVTPFKIRPVLVAMLDFKGVPRVWHSTNPLTLPQHASRAAPVGGAVSRVRGAWDRRTQQTMNATWATKKENNSSCFQKNGWFPNRKIRVQKFSNIFHS